MHAPSFKLGRLDWMLLFILTFFSCMISFWGLGAREAPVTEWKSTSDHQSVVYQVNTDDSFYMMFYVGLIPYGSYDVSICTSTDGVTWRVTQELSFAAYDSFQWQYAMSPSQELLPFREPYIRIEIDKPGLSLWETAFLTRSGDIIPVVSIENAGEYDEAYQPALLIDEQSVVPVKPDYRNSMYFDEIHYATAGYEYQVGSVSYEFTHPPLGKLLIMLGIKFFGMTPFGWRFSGALAGALVVPLMYIMGKLLFSRTWFALLSAVLMRLDLLLLVQSRMATIDSFLLLFILASYVCFIYFMQVSEHRKSTLMFLYRAYWKYKNRCGRTI